MKTLEQRKQEVLRKIQNNFICDDAHASITFPTDSRYDDEKINIKIHEV
jgi:hypothetical protein